MNLRNYWLKLANGENVLVIYKTNYYKMVKLPNNIKRKNIKLVELNNKENVKGLLLASQSNDSYELLENKVKKKNLREVILNYNKNFTKFDNYLEIYEDMREDNKVIKLRKLYII